MYVRGSKNISFLFLRIIWKVNKFVIQSFYDQIPEILL